MRKTSIGSILAVALIAFCGLAPDAHAAPRVRQNIKDLTAAEQQTFVDAMFALQNPANFVPVGGWPADMKLPQNRYEQFVRAHDTNGNLIHHTAAARSNPIFLPWHRQFLFQMENDVRSLGGAFANFALPYWDGTRDAYPMDKKGANPGDPPVPNALLGGDGVAGDAFRVATGPFANPTNLNTAWRAYNANAAGTPADPSRTPLKRQFGQQNPAPTAPATTPPAGSFTRLTTGYAALTRSGPAPQRPRPAASPR